MVAFRFTEELSLAYSGSFKLVSGGESDCGFQKQMLSSDVSYRSLPGPCARGHFPGVLILSV